MNVYNGLSDEEVKKYRTLYGDNEIKRTKKDSFFKRTTAQMFYKVMAAFGVKTVYNHADYRLMSKRALQEFSKYQEINLYLRGVMPLIGYETDCVYYERKERVAGESKYPLKKMLALAALVLFAMTFTSCKAKIGEAKAKVKKIF